MGEMAVKGLYTVAEEVAHAITHGIGLLLSVAALAVIVVRASLYGDAWQIVSVSVYGATLVLLYGASTLYHAVPAPRTKSALQVLDFASIYLLIAGTYTPFTLVNLRGGWGWALFGVVWGLALLGIAMEAFARQFARSISLVLYIAIGWVAAVAVKPVFELVPPGGIALLVAGGVAYTGGVVFYCWRRLPYNHAVWHVFVVAGSVLHFFAVLLYVVPATNG
jgi:hemolysin III